MRRLALALALAWVACAASARADDVVARVHYAGAADLNRQTNYATAAKLLDLPTSVDFRDLALRRFSDFLAEGFPGHAASASKPIEPLLLDWLRTESVVVAGGPENSPLQFIAAIRLDSRAAQAWNAALGQAAGQPSQDITATGATGWRWGSGADSVWLLQARDWILVGRGNGLESQRNGFLAEIQKQGRPVAPLDGKCLEADVDWPRLKHWLPLSFGPLKLARTKIELTATPDQILRLTAQVTYPQPIDWHPQPWNPPTKLVFDPVISFTALQDVAAFMERDPFAGLSGDPLPGQLYCWAMAEMPFQSYMAWPVSESTNLLQRMQTNLPPTLDPVLKDLNDGELLWSAQRNQITWRSPMLRFVFPTLNATCSDSQPFLEAEMFPAPTKRHTNAPAVLFIQFDRDKNVVYYDWEITRPRLEHWRLLSELLPIEPRASAAELHKEREKVAATTNAPPRQRYIPSFVVADGWLAGIAPHLNTETITEITMTSPTELTIKRRAPLVFTAFELELLTHWLANAPSVGHVDRSLLPPPPKISGPGVRPH